MRQPIKVLGFGQYALTQTSINYSDDIQITLEDPVAKYISDTCGFEYSINGGDWIVWDPTTTPIVIDTTDLTIGENVVLMRHDTTCGGESLVKRIYLYIIRSSGFVGSYANDRVGRSLPYRYGTLYGKYLYSRV